MKRPQIGKNIKSYRVRARMTQQELAAVLATTQGHIGQVERYSGPQIENQGVNVFPFEYF